MTFECSYTSTNHEGLTSSNSWCCVAVHRRSPI